jgi:hypothetical protein
MLAAARAAMYPVDASGATSYSPYTAENNLSHGAQASQLVGPGGVFASGMTSADQDRNSDQINAKLVAEQSGGKAFANINSLSDVMQKVSANSSDFYTLSYSPTDAKMDGNYRKIDVKVEGGKYNISYRRGYFAVDGALPGSSMRVRGQEVQKVASRNPGAVDPLLPYMDLGMPQSEQILYKIRVVPAGPRGNEAPDKKDKNHYAVDFAINLKDVDLKLDAAGMRKGMLNVSLTVYDRYGNVICREAHLADLDIKPDVYTMFQNTGVQLHADLAVPRGNYWLRTGVYDQSSRKVGTMEIPLSAVKPLETAGK